MSVFSNLKMLLVPRALSEKMKSEYCRKIHRIFKGRETPSLLLAVMGAGAAMGRKSIRIAVPRTVTRDR